MTVKERLAATVSAPGNILEQALFDAEGTILDITNRTDLTGQLEHLQVTLAQVYVHRILAAGEASRSEGEVSVSYAYSKDIPEDLMKRILSYRKLKQAGVANANKKS